MFNKLQLSGASPALMPTDLSIAGATTLYGTMRASELWLFLAFGASLASAGNNITITLSQATSSLGAGNKALRVKEAQFMKGAPTLSNSNASVQEIWQNSLLFSREASADSWVTSSDRGANTNQFFAAIRVRGCDLDLMNGYKCVRASIPRCTNAQQCFGMWFSEEARIL